MERLPRLTIELDGDFKKQIKEEVAKKGTTLKFLVINLLSEWLKETRGE